MRDFRHSSRLPRNTGRTGIRSARVGFTLFELIIVLAVLAIIASLAWPNVVRTVRQQSLLSSSDTVRGLAASARVRAIESGLIYQFRYEPGGQHFLVAPFEIDLAGMSAGSRSSGVVSGLGKLNNASGTLEKGLMFAASKAAGMSSTSGSTASNVPLGTGQHISPVALTGLKDAGKLGSVSWSGPILFYPNGSATDSLVDVMNKQHERVTLRVRGLTGAVSTSRIHTGR